MASSHHGASDKPQPELLQRFLDQVEGRHAKREYTRGRLGAEDEGALALAVAADKRTRTVVIDFGKPVSWVGLGPSDVNNLIGLLVAKMRDLGEVVTVKM